MSERTNLAKLSDTLTKINVPHTVFTITSGRYGFKGDHVLELKDGQTLEYGCLCFVFDKEGNYKTAEMR